MRLKYLVFFLFFALTFLQKVSAQNMKVTGYVVDTTGQKPLSNVSVLAVRMKDSLLLKYTRTNTEGYFELSNFKVDTFYVHKSIGNFNKIKKDIFFQEFLLNQIQNP